MASNTTDVVWCLICEQRPAEGTLRRVFRDSLAPVAPDGPRAVPRVCQRCADEHHRTPAQRARNRETVWDFTYEGPCEQHDREDVRT